MGFLLRNIVSFIGLFCKSNASCIRVAARMNTRLGYGLATMSRRHIIIGRFCRISSLLQGSFAQKETYDVQNDGVATISRPHKIIVLFGKEPCKRDDILQKRPMMLKRLLIEPPHTLHVYSRRVFIRAATCMQEAWLFCRILYRVLFCKRDLWF